MKKVYPKSKNPIFYSRNMGGSAYKLVITSEGLDISKFPDELVEDLFQTWGKHLLSEDQHKAVQSQTPITEPTQPQVETPMPEPQPEAPVEQEQPKPEEPVTPSEEKTEEPVADTPVIPTEEPQAETTEFKAEDNSSQHDNNKPHKRGFGRRN